MKRSLFFNYSREERFWNWFFKHQETYYHEIENLEIREEIFDNLSNELDKVHKGLVFEFSKIHENGIREFTISADGVKDLFPIVEQLVKKATKMDNWQFHAFRQRLQNDTIELLYKDFKISYADLYFRYQDGGYGNVGIELNIKNFDESSQMKNAIYILLDCLIGEYDVTVGIDCIEWVKLDESNIDKLYPITYLRTLLDSKKN
jgi:hypothetical protein